MTTPAESRPEHPRRSRDQHDAVIEQTTHRRDHRGRARAPLIVVGIDTSEASPHALAYAAGAARRMHATVLVAYISTLATSAYLTSLAPMGADLPTDLTTEQVTATRELATEILHDLPLPWSFTVRCGDPAVELARLAEENNADSLVVGRSSSRLHRLTGSTAARLLRRTRCPVTVVP
ncbi:universal stress protein [Nocardia cyriacigeorgica]|uniref:Universal stress protein family n=1 Tax=Nocardia cyriacigeorgica TaxID=135487 RepID=A0A4U8VXC9_9NOCA|nr:universal stress protein [Nocardia cyriacigeorgica]MBF6095178.1 universal stress protein [Nocardia cyriacigeorgica]MBF6160436.1 universal stress protein [Nocardia cyriacigeorgica]MBF6199797.1 universal stress protein [Nocardia cyriacigeorgica]VFA97335.1 Universal stress protein family [Nocardia cyriacigeorgica]